MGAPVTSGRVRGTIARVAVAAGIVVLAAPGARAEVKTYIVAGVGFLTVAGDADVADQREAGWSLAGGIRRRLTERISIGLSGEFGNANLDPAAFFEEREIFLSDPERHVNGGKMTILGGGVEGIYEYPIDRGTIVYGKLGAGYYQWSVETIFVNAEELGVEDRVPSQILFEDESGFGGSAGLGVRFPIGESAGLWAELSVEVLTGAGGGSMQLVPLRAGISLP